jgi:predicted ATPase/class 3 adenylate cyclase
MDVAAWLGGLGLEQYAPAFRDNAVDGEVLRELTADDLKDLGVTLVGHRRKLLAAIAALAAEPPAHDVAQSGASAPTSHLAIDAERRQLTVMFCDLVGSTALSTRFDPEDLRELIGDYHRAVTDTVGRFDGFVAKYMGDGVLVYFGYPRAHEDDAERAVRAGLAVIEAVGRLPAQQELRVRLGIATGLAVVGDLIGTGAAQERGVVGETPNLAARLQALAAPNTLVIGPATRRQIGGLFDLEDLGPRQLAGFGEPQRAWRVLGESGEVSRFEALRSGETPLVGRDEEIELLTRHWQQAKSGEGRVVLISGEPGIGKSRLTAALSEHIEAERHTRLRYFCSPHHQDSALHPFIAQLERAASFARDDGPEEKLDKLATLLAPAAEAGDVSLLVELLSLPGDDRFAPLALSPQRKKERTFAALLRQLEGLARTQPILMIFEDLHWIDPSSREFLDLILARIDRLRVLLVATFRPEFQPPWTGQPYVTVASLNRLGPDDGATMVERLASNIALLPPDVIAEIVERTDGVPLFVEEMTKAVLEAGAERGREIAASVPSTGLGVPATLQASLMARLDRLGPAAKGVAQFGAAIGREFSYELAASFGDLSEERFQEALQRLVDAGLVFQRGAPPTAVYLFKHALVQDTAYGTLLRGPRQAFHLKIAGALKERFPMVAETQPEILAHHFAQAGMPAEAAELWLRAGHLARRRSANAEAAAHLGKGLEQIAALPTPQRAQRELEIQHALAEVLMATKGYGSPEAAAAARRASELCQQVEDRDAVMRVLLALRSVSQVQGNSVAARQYGTRCLEIAQSQGSRGLAVEANASLAHTLVQMASFAEASDHVADALSEYDRDFYRARLPAIGLDPRVFGLGVMGWNDWFLGYPDRALRAAVQGVKVARELNHPQTLDQSLASAAHTHLLRREAEIAMDILDEALSLSREQGFPMRVALTRLFRSWALSVLGEYPAAVREISEVLPQYRATGARAWQTIYLAVLGNAYRGCGAITEGLSTIREARDLAKVQDEYWWYAELHRLEGDLMVAAAQPDEAEQCYRDALATACKQQARSWELRAATSLARLQARQGRQAEGRDLLAPVYSWFTEGFDTADLKEAAALLGELA